MSSWHLLLLLFCCWLFKYKCNCCCCCCCCHLGSLEVTGAPMEAAHPCPHSPCWMGLQPYTSLHIASNLQNEDSWASFIFRVPWNKVKTLTMLDGPPTLHIFTHSIKKISVHLFHEKHFYTPETIIPPNNYWWIPTHYAGWASNPTHLYT